jgi:large subunit ribosomal protein LP2
MLGALVLRSVHVHVRAAVGIEADSERVDALISELEGKDIAEVIAAGASKLASVPAGGGVAMASSGGAPRTLRQ